MVYDSKNISQLKSAPVLEDGQVYIYALLNYPQGNIKIGKTTNIVQRLQSLSGSNGGSNKIIRLYHSPLLFCKAWSKHVIIIIIGIG